MRLHRRYISVVFTGVVLASMLVAAVNLYVDPFAASGWLASPKFASARLQESSRTLKANQLVQSDFDFVILGSSRMELGIDPNAEGVRELGRGYNAGLPGSNLFETRRVLRFVIEQGRVDAIFIGIELVMFSEFRNEVADFRTSGFADVSVNSGVDRSIQSMLGASSLSASWRMLTNSNLNDPPRLNDGFRASPSFVGNPRELSEQLSRYYLSSPEAYFEFKFDEAKLADLEWIAQTCGERQIDLYLFVPPVHVEQLELIARAGLWTEFERVKREITRIASENDTQKAAITAWDFTGTEGIVREPIPRTDDGQAQMKYYYEISHFRPAVGAAVIRQMVAGAKSDMIDVRGMQLEPENIDEHLQSMRQINTLSP